MRIRVLYKVAAFTQVLFWGLAGLSWSAESDLYNFSWLDPDKKVYVLQNKVYPKKGTSYVNLGVLLGLAENSNYQNVVGPHFTVGYYLFEEWAFEVLYHHYISSDNDVKKSVARRNFFPFLRNYKSKVGGMFLWSPFYGKINTFNKIFYFDWSFGLGGGSVVAENNSKTVAGNFSDVRFDAESLVAVLTKTSFRFYINKFFHTGIEYHWDIYQGVGPKDPKSTEAPQKKLRFNHDLVFLLGFSF